MRSETGCYLPGVRDFGGKGERTEERLQDITE